LAQGEGALPAGIEDRCVALLRDALANETEWVRVHAAEALLSHGLGEGVEAVYAPLVDSAPPHRIGVWRVLARAQADDARQRYIARVRDAFLDIDGPDRLHAAETLAKLGYAERLVELLRVAREESGAFQAYARWALANSGTAADEAALAELLTSDDARTRGCAAYGLRFLPVLREATLAALDAALDAEPVDSPARIHQLCAHYAHGQGERRAKVEEALVRLAREGDKGERYQACAALGLGGDAGIIGVLVERLEDAETNVRISAADALLALHERLACF